MTTVSDEALVMAARGGNRQAFATLVQRYSAAAKAVAFHILHDHHLSGAGSLYLQQAMPGMPAFPGHIRMEAQGGNRVFVTPGADAHVEVMTTGQNGQVSTFESQYSDGKDQLTIVRRDNKKVLTIRDLQGKQLFDGPVDTVEQQQAIPKNLLPKFQEMHKMPNVTDDSPKP